MYLGEASRCDCFSVKLAEDIFELALKVVFVNYLDFLEGKCWALVLKDFKLLNILLRCDSLQSAYVLTSLKVDSSA
jgi:hypothetical protein